MQLIIHDRRPLDVAPTGEALLTIEHKGTFSFSIAAVAALGLRPTDEVVLAQDGKTNTWYLLLDPTSEMDAFELRPRDKSSKALMFCCQHRARAYYQAHGLGQQKSVRSLVGATAVEHDGLKLYPLTPQHPTKSPMTLAAPVVEPSAPAPAEPAAQPDVAPLPTDLPHLQDEQPAAPAMVATAPAPVGDTTEGLSREEQLAEDWNERDLGKAEDGELANLVKVLGNVPSRQRGFVEEKVLSAAKKEVQTRKVKGGRRG